MATRKKAKAPRAAGTEPAAVATVDETVKSEEVVAESPDTGTETGEKVKEEKDKKGKSCKGIWIAEMKGPYGWERIATAFMRNGEYLAAGPNHYALGSYKLNGNKFEMSASVTHYGELRTIFGRKSTGKMQITSKCKFDKDKMIGTSRTKSIKNFDVMVRFSKVDSLK
jgi:hypothetical protein